MRTVWKYELTPGPHLDGAVELSLPAGAEVLTVQEQFGAPHLWALVDSDESMNVSRYLIVGTGHPVPDDVAADDYVGTFQLGGGTLVFHLFELSDDRGS